MLQSYIKNRTGEETVLHNYRLGRNLSVLYQWKNHCRQSNIDMAYLAINKTYQSCEDILINISTFAGNKSQTTNNYA